MNNSYLINNNCSENNGNGVLLIDCSNNTIAGNQVTNNTFNGILLYNNCFNKMNLLFFIDIF